MAKPGRGRRSSPSGSLSGSSSRSRSPSRSRSISRSLSRSRSFSSSSSPSRSVSSRSRSPPPQRKKRMPESSDITRDDYKPLWKFVTKGEKKVRGGGNVLFTCNYCGNYYKGTYSRVKAHLLKLQGLGIGPCNKVSNKDIVDMKKLEDDACAKKIASMSKKVLMSPSTHASRIVSSSSSCSFNSFRVESLGIETKRRKGVEECPLEKAYNNHERDELRAHIAKMFYSGGLPFHLARNPYYVSSFTYACTHNLSGFIPPGYNLLQNSLLQQEKARIERILQTIKTTWKDKGVTIVCDGWSDPQRRPFINFMAVTESDSIFIKAVNCEGEYKDKEFIANAILGVIREVGVENVVQVITDNAPVCKAAGVLIEVEYPHIFWTPCVVHTLNLALKNICNVKNKKGNEVAFNELGWIRKIADDAMMVKNFIMNHNMRLAIFNEFVPLKLLAIADTRFASIIIMLKRFKLVKNGLQSMVISDKWNLYREDDVGKAQFVKDKILNDVWWDKIDFILAFTSPIYDILRMGDTNKPSLHKIYEGWNSMIEQVKKAIFCHEGKLDSEESTFFNVVYDILVQKWTKSNTPLYCLAHSLTPSPAEAARQGRSPTSQSKRTSPLPRKLSPVRESLVLHIDKLSRNVNEGHLKEIFSNFGEVVNVELAMDRTVNLPKGCGYVEFKTRRDAEKALLYMDGGQIDGVIIKARFTLPARHKVSPPPKVTAVSPKRDAPRTDHASADVGKDGPKQQRESSPRRNLLPSPRRRSPVPRRTGSPRRMDSPRCHADSPVRRRLDCPYRRGDTPPRRRAVSPAKGRSPSPPRRLRSPARVSPRRMHGGLGRRHSPPPLRRRSPLRRARSPPRRSPIGRRCSRSPIRRPARFRSRSFSPRRGRQHARRGRSSSYSDSPSPRKLSRQSRSRSPRRPLRGRGSSNSSSTSSPPPSRKP